jgi:hypothetical protein
MWVEKFSSYFKEAEEDALWELLTWTDEAALQTADLTEIKPLVTPQIGG